MLTKENYKPRLIDDKITHFLKIFGAISLEGPKWCGKTWTALNHANSAVYLNNPANDYQDRRYAQMDPTIIMGKDAPELLDEWQEVPTLWDAVRYACDQDNATGKYLLTGSATPAKSIHHSGAGRICRLHMYTMSLSETGDSTNQVSLKDLFDDTVKNTPVPGADISQIIYWIIRGGWPANLNKNIDDAMLVPTSYLNDVIMHDISAIDGVSRNQTKMEQLIRSLARNESSIATNQRLLTDISEKDVSDSATIGKNTITDYLDILNQLYITDDIPAYSPNLRSSNRVGTAVKRHFTDVSLASAALGLTHETLFNDLNTLGLLFESLCLHDLRIYIDYLGGKLYHFRSGNGLEVDAIVELPDGRYGAIEIKLGTDSEDAAATNLLKFNDLMEEKPAFLAVVNGLGKAALRRPDGVYALPINSLHP